MIDLIFGLTWFQPIAIGLMSLFMLGHMLFTIYRCWKQRHAFESYGYAMGVLISSYKDTKLSYLSYTDEEKYKLKHRWSLREDGVIYSKKQKGVNLFIFWVLLIVLVAVLFSSNMWVLCLLPLMVLPQVVLLIIQFPVFLLLLLEGLFRLFGQYLRRGKAFLKC